MTDKVLYLECACGISGDMTVAALLDLGASREKLDRALASLELENFGYEVSRSKSYGVAGCDFEVTIGAGHHHHGHDGDDHHHHDHEHRNLADVYEVIDRGDMSAAARELAKKIFDIVAVAEAEAHGCNADEVHFHEVGAIDSIADIVGAAVLADDLGVSGCVVTGMVEGSGFVRCQHGDLPVPVPAVLNIARRFGIPLTISDARGEMVTPTGIAIAAALRTTKVLPESFTVDKVGIGLGKRDFGRPNMLRAMLLGAAAGSGRLFTMEANIDDSTGEALGLAMEELFKAGARDVHFVPCFMKKNRPGCLLRIIADEALLPALEEVVFRTTTTIGLRKYPVTRTCMERETVEAVLPFGIVKLKKCSYGGIVRFYPEYESVKAAAASSGLDFRTVFELARQAGENHG
ncbi:MAG: nickel pincer cofactor biosynthesis protein LarC [Victivallaceae bacterium]